MDLHRCLRVGFCDCVVGVWNRDGEGWVLDFGRVVVGWCLEIVLLLCGYLPRRMAALLPDET